jgi:hypothetical protein
MISYTSGCKRFVSQAHINDVFLALRVINWSLTTVFSLTVADLILEPQFYIVFCMMAILLGVISSAIYC